MTGSFMESFFDRVESRRNPWPAGRADLHWHLLPDQAVVREALVEPYRAITHRPGLAPVPAPWVHCTLLHAGPVDQYRDEEIDAIIERVAKECQTIAPFDLVFDRPTVGTVAVECAARPGEPARQLWELTARADAEITGGRFPLIPAVYYPHISLAYGNRGELQQTGARASTIRPDRRELKAALADLPGEPVVLRADRLCLVAQQHDRQHITWTPIAEVPLQAPAR
ncbi:2'-5' RNA ligase family protein (plasmid) [Streptoverticillium reticulum]|uniref:2'-5' RNA ligase family protein n=1 Tax=Streptoverticillium reticulum TaxID=1433415 RepID=UPI0039BFC1D1